LIILSQEAAKRSHDALIRGVAGILGHPLAFLGVPAILVQDVHRFTLLLVLSEIFMPRGNLSRGMQKATQGSMSGTKIVEQIKKKPRRSGA
jgi:hypothetical protein